MIQILNNIINLFGTKWLIFLTIISLFCYNFIIKYWWYFKIRDVKCIRGIPFIGTQYKMLLGIESLSESFEKLYRNHPNEQFYGIYEFGGTPGYVIRDPELIKKITIKDFDHFVDHRFHIDVEVDSLFGRSLFFMKGQKWRDMRATLSPAFTVSKMKMMFNLILKCSHQLTEQLADNAEKSLEPTMPSITWEMKDLFTRFASDVIATCAFGFETNSLKELNNEFYSTGKDITSFDGIGIFKFFANASMPNLMKYLKFSFGFGFMNARQTNYFRKIVLGNIEYREKNNIIRPDTINLLLQAKKGLLKHDDNDDDNNNNVGGYNDQNATKLKKWEDDDIVAQSVNFFLAGFDTISTVLSFAAHEITVNPDVQQKIYEEIIMIKNDMSIDEDLTYDQVQKMKYLEAVINETMRRWSPLAATERCVTKPYTLERNDGRKIQLKIGEGIWIPSQGLQMDAKYFPNPDKFDPERFNDENIKNVQPFTFMPFGVGPRNCIGSRFAMMECKIILYTLLLKFRFEMCEKTQHPLQTRRNTGNVDAANGFWVKLVQRNA